MPRVQNGLKDEQCCQKADLCMKIVRVTAGNIYSFRIRTKENASDNISKLV